MSSICICFPLSEPPRSFYPEEQKIASRVKCPIHGERFQRRERLLRFHSMWLLERRFQSYLRRTEQYRRAWAVSFPDWPTKDEDDENVYLLFKDGSKYIAWRKAAPSDSIHWRSHQVKGPDERPIGTDANKNRCRATTKNGNPCQAAATGGGLCFFHANPKKASELGQIGGRKNRRRSVEMDPLPPLENVMAIRTTLQRIISETYSGRLPSRTAAILGPLLNGLLRVIESADYEQRLTQIERRLEEGLNQSDTSVPKMREKIEQLERELAEHVNPPTSTAEQRDLRNQRRRNDEPS